MLDLSDTSEYLNISCSDLNLYFAGTYLKIISPETAKPEWMFVQEFRNEDGSVSEDEPPEEAEEGIDVVVTGTSAIKRTLIPIEEFKADFSFPQVGLYNYKKTVVLMSRGSHRQNKKAVCKGTISFFNTFELFRAFHTVPERFLMTNGWKWSTRDINNVFSFNSYQSLPEAFRRVSQLKDFSRALSPNFFIGQGIDTRAPSLWYRKTLIGTVLNKSSVLIRNPSFLQEAKDFFLPEGVTVNANA